MAYAIVYIEAHPYTFIIWNKGKSFEMILTKYDVISNDNVYVEKITAKTDAECVELPFVAIDFLTSKKIPYGDISVSFNRLPSNDDHEYGEFSNKDSAWGADQDS